MQLFDSYPYPLQFTGNLATIDHPTETGNNMTTKADNSSTIYRAIDSTGEPLALCATFAKAREALRDNLETEHHRRDLGTLTLIRLGDSLPFSGFSIAPASSEDDRALALALALDIDLEDITGSTYAENGYDADGGEFTVLTDEEATADALEQCEQLAWAFNPSFLAEYLPPGGEQAVAAMQDQCEGANDAVLALLGDRATEAFENAIGCDGRGHFLGHYDGEEHEAEVGGCHYYIYRTN